VKSFTGKELAKLLENHDWQLKRIQGSHHIYIKPDRIERISIPIHSNQNLKIGLLKHLLKLAGISEKEL
jgi:predicted RNA binding protein YcfA (HicA-like mRNA interferase family)